MMCRAALLASVVLLLLHSAASAAELRPGDASPPLALEDIKGRALAVPSPGHVMLLSFASRSTAEATGEITRAIRVDYPGLEILSFIDLSGLPGFMHAIARERMAARQEGAVKATQAAFAAAGREAPDDLDARIHIIPDFDAKTCEAFGATDAGNQPMIVLIGKDGRVKAIFQQMPSLAEVEAAVANETSSKP